VYHWCPARQGLFSHTYNPFFFLWHPFFCSAHLTFHFSIGLSGFFFFPIKRTLNTNCFVETHTHTHTHTHKYPFLI
jgi:hypothetical protein